MKKVLYSLGITLGFLFTYFTAAAAQSKPESITKTVVANVPVPFIFTGSDMCTDTMVKITMQAECTVTVTRTANANLPASVCGDFSQSVVVDERPGNGRSSCRDSAQRSVYRIEGDQCDLAFPAKIDIFYSGVARRVPNTNAYHTRMIRYRPGDGCADVTYEINDQVDPSTADPKGGGGEGGFSYFFLADVDSTEFLEKVEIVSLFDDLAKRVHPTTHQRTVEEARDQFVDGEDDPPASARMKFIASLNRLNGLLPQLVDPESKARLPRILFQIRQLSARRTIDLP
jgi:hypothetical protein